MMRCSIVLFLTWLAPAILGTAQAHADTIYTEDFQSGKSIGWIAVGEGDVRLSSYAENVSLQLHRGATAVREVSTDGYDGVRLDVSFAALSLGEDDACIADVSSDSGHHWTEIFRVTHGQDDGITLHSGGAVAGILNNQPRLVIRLRNTSNNPTASCWADNIVLTGEREAEHKLRPAFGIDGKRLAFSYAELTSASSVAGPADMLAFTASVGAKPASNVFQGRLSLGVERAGSAVHVLKDVYGDDSANNGAARHLPDFDFAFVQSGGALIPVRRGAVQSSHPEWEFVLEPGQVWDETGDHGLTRAAVPFTLEERNAICMHNGMMTFLFGKSGLVSDVAYEIAHETCFYFKLDMWGRMTARYTAQPVPDAADTVKAHAMEVSGRMATRPIEELAQKFPGSDPSQFGSALEIAPSDMTLFGVVANGVNYVGGCGTRFGTYPECSVLDLPSYSLAKSFFAGLGTMRLNLQYPGVTSERIADYVPDCREAGTWNDVTFGNMLDMASGHYNSAADQADEDAADLQPFFLAEDHASRIKFSCTHYPRKGPPGVRWVYHTADTYLLGTALNAFYRSKKGDDFFKSVLSGGIWNELALSPPSYVVRRTRDGVAQPFSGYGVTLQRDDIAKLANFINVDHGAVAGQQLVDPKMLRAALQQDPSDRGLPASADEYRYHNGFWAWNAQHVLGCKSETWIPFMSGYGGIAVALMPNGFSYYYFSDGGVWAWARAARETDRIKPFCER